MRWSLRGGAARGHLEETESVLVATWQHMANAMLSVSYNTKPPRIHQSSNLVQGLVDENRVCTVGKCVCVCVGKCVDNNSHYGVLNGHDRRFTWYS